MQILKIDTREKDQARIDKIVSYCLNHDIAPMREKLDIGDYLFDDNRNVVVDTKKSILEVATNLFNKNDKNRFLREIIKAKNLNIKMIVLIEENFTIENLSSWHCPSYKNGKPYTNLKGFQIANKMRFYEKYYGVKFEFCHKNGTAKRIIDLLTTY